MSRLTEIKQKIIQLDGGSFQEFCDTYLFMAGYKNIMPLGMKSGTNKTTKGIPDTYFYESRGKYILVMYTTQQSNTFNKIHEDICDCFNPEKTGISVRKITEIIYCHTSDKITVGEDDELRKLCRSKNVLLQLKGIDEIANDIYTNYPGLARDFLGVSISTDQVFNMQEFISEYDQNKMAAPLSTKFQFREKEVEEISGKIEVSDVIMITGQAGVGKTRLALECGQKYAEEYDYKFYCIHSNFLPVYEDIKVFLNKPDKYLLLVDDANQITKLQHILQFLNKRNQGYDIKIILTVRDYAKREVIQDVYKFTNPELFLINNLSDEEIKDMLIENLEILNEKYQKKILSIAEGNARLAMIAGKLAVETQSLDSINDATQLYEGYYGSFLRKNVNDKILYATAGIIAFLSAINLEHLDSLLPIFEELGISKESFINYTRYLHDLELVDIYNDKAVKISDQSFSNYLLKYVFIDENIIPYSVMVKNCFSNYRTRVINSTNILSNIFTSVDIYEELKKELGKVWDEYKEQDNPLFFEFVKVFHFMRPTETLVILKNKISKLPQGSFNLDSLDFEKKSRSNMVIDDILKILGGFSDRKELPESLDLLFLYLKKQPQSIMDCYHSIKNYLSIKIDSHAYGYRSQKQLINKFNQYSDDWNNDIITFLFIKVAAELLKLFFSPTKMERGNKFTMYKIPVQLNYGSKQYRKMIWENLLELYSRDKYQLDIEKIIREYNQHFADKVDQSIIKFDYTYIEIFFKEKFTPQKLSHGIIAKRVSENLERYGIKENSQLMPYLTSNDYIIYETLIGKNHRTGIGWEKEKELNEEAIRIFANNCNRKKVDQIISVCIDFENYKYENEGKILSGLSYLFSCLSSDRDLFIFAVNKYLENDTPVNVYPSNIILSLFEIISYEETYQLINKYNYKQKNAWLFSFYENFPSEIISEEYVQDLYDFFSMNEGNITSSPYRDLEFLEKYKKVDPDVYIKSSRIIAKKYEYSPFIFSIYFAQMFNPYSKKPDIILKQYKRDWDLLKDIYLKLIEYDNNGDYDGVFLLAFIKFDPSFIDEYIDFTIEQKRTYTPESVDRLSVIWDGDNFIDQVDRVFYRYSNSEELVEGEISSFIKNIIVCQDKEGIRINRQDEWIRHFIDNNYNDQRLMEILFSSITVISPERRRKHILYLVQVNSDPELFKRIDLERNSWGGWGSMIPHMEKRIDFLKSLLPDLSGLEYLEHKAIVKEYIKIWERRIEREQIDEVLEFRF
ncbi:MAG: ATP-binding protein [Halanaerobiales bacterium]